MPSTPKTVRLSPQELEIMSVALDIYKLEVPSANLHSFMKEAALSRAVLVIKKYQMKKPD